MRVAIIGAGIAGLAAARQLKSSGLEAVVYEKSDGFGGRVATQTINQFIFDTGAQNFACQGTALENVILNELDKTDLVKLDKPILVHDGRRTSAGDRRINEQARYSYRFGNSQLADLLANGLEIKTSSIIDQIEQVGNQYKINESLYDGVILTAPVPQSSLFLWGLKLRRATAQCRYRSCISIQLGYDFDPQLSFLAAICLNESIPLQWFGIESNKSADRAPDGCLSVVAQMSAAYSQSAWELPDERLVQQATSSLAEILGEKLLRPAFSNVKKWKYSQPEEIAMFHTANRKEDHVVLAGDGVIGGRVELAYDSGIKAALLLEGALG